ncbi:MAG: hypothetical protein GY730_01515 [bacterium]|nr:hypothetical protein [bacterium]
MKSILLADIHHYKNQAINKDMMGGYGTSSQFQVSKLSLITKILEKYKAQSIILPNLTLGCLAGIFHKNGWQIDFTTEMAKINRHYDIVLIYGSVPEFSNEQNFARLIKKQHKKTLVGFAGTLPSVKPGLYEDIADFILMGEPERSLVNVNLNEIKFKGQLKFNKKATLDELPFPYWKPFLKKRRFIHSFLLGRKPMLSLYASRGCPMPCAYYCPYPLQQGNQIALRDPKQILEEIRHNLMHYGIENYLYRDPCFGFNKSHLTNLLNLKIAKNLKIKWAAEMHLQFLDEPIIKLMKQSGCTAITTGIESIDENSLVNSKRNHTSLSKTKEILHLLDKYKIKVMAGYILGNLKDSEKSLKKTFEFAKAMNTSYAQFTISTPYFGTHYFNDLKKQISTTNIEDFGAYKLTFKHPQLTDTTLDILKATFFKKYYLRWSWLLKHIKEYFY